MRIQLTIKADVDLQKYKTMPPEWLNMGFPQWLSDKESACNAGDVGSIPGLGRSSEERNGNPLQYSHLENPMNRGAWWATVHGVTKVGQNLATELTKYGFGKSSQIM